MEMLILRLLVGSRQRTLYPWTPRRCYVQVQPCCAQRARLHDVSPCREQFNGYWPAETIKVVPGPAKSNFDFSMVKIHTQSHSGTVKLASNDPRDTPLINFRFFEGPGADADLDAYVEAVEMGRRVFASLNSTLGPWRETLPCKGAIQRVMPRRLSRRRRGLITRRAHARSVVIATLLLS